MGFEDRFRIEIHSRDKEYAEALAKILALRYKSLHVVLIDQLTEIDSDEAVLQLVEGNDKATPVVDRFPARLLLCENEAVCDEKAGRLFKYAAVTELAGQCLDLFGRLSGHPRFIGARAEFRLILFGGVAGGVGTTALCLSVARELARFHEKRVLFLSFENPSSAAVYFTEAEAKAAAPAGDYLYYCFSNNPSHMLAYPERFIVTDGWGIDTLLPGPGFNEIAALESGEFERLLEILGRVRRYDYILLDLPLTGDEWKKDLIKRAALLVTVSDQSAVSQIKRQNWAELLPGSEETVDDGSIDRLDVYNRWTLRDGFNAEDSETGRACWIAEDPESFTVQDGHILIDLNKAYGLGVKKIADELIRAK